MDKLALFGGTPVRPRLLSYATSVVAGVPGSVYLLEKFGSRWLYSNRHHA